MELKYHYVNAKGNQYNRKSENFKYDTITKSIDQYFSVVRTAIKKQNNG